MEPARIKKKFDIPHSWEQLKTGPWVRESIQMRLDEWCPKLFGYHLLKLGGLSCELMSKNCCIQHQIHLDSVNPLHTIIADRYHLPFMEKSIDAVIMSHQLDYSNDPHRLLREVDRVLVDDGYIIITGFNPISLTGISSLLPWRKKYLPWSGRMFTPNRIKDWLGVLNYEVIECDQYALFPFQTYRPFWTWLENKGQCSRAMGCLYFIVARKRTYPLKLVKPHWRLKRPLTPISVNYRAQLKPFKYSYE
ncbi:class I SAM-dependent methyltransferase [Vibrio sp.]|uniref:Class I SAM-dependent methyltransferase n=1 Tax=Vibrio viridaestus TaxID=2487322 RepID=A0A3N9U311_9VIBR|nr:class I SAM-dependent methyltransferase [Vibrio viridaestus]MDC0609871.1 class I SAM-dependent methyltransferase [Vibrio sp.]RQW63962.1 class I SAM-dependent methyltransferase [Vibrio viridaestus]